MVDYSTLELPDGIECFVLESTTSTNDHLIKLPFSKDVKVCIAREQTAGKGQYQRSWLSKKDSSVLLSLRYPFSIDTNLNGLSLIVGLSVIDVLKNDYGINHLKLKWPNDVFFDNKKLAGILIENSVQNSTQSVVIGLGLNHHLDDDFECETPWVDLFKMTGEAPNLVELQEKIIKNLLNYCQYFEQRGLDNFQSQWAAHDYLLGKRLELNYQDKKTIGIASGINTQGALMIDADGAMIEAYSSEQIRLI